MYKSSGQDVGIRIDFGGHIMPSSNLMDIDW